MVGISNSKVKFPRERPLSEGVVMSVEGLGLHWLGAVIEAVELDVDVVVIEVDDSLHSSEIFGGVRGGTKGDDSSSLDGLGPPKISGLASRPGLSASEDILGLPSNDPSVLPAVHLPFFLFLKFFFSHFAALPNLLLPVTGSISSSPRGVLTAPRPRPRRRSALSTGTVEGASVTIVMVERLRGMKGSSSSSGLTGIWLFSSSATSTPTGLGSSSS